MAFDAYQDPRLAPFEVPRDAISEEALDGLVESYCTQFHGLNDVEDPISHKNEVYSALKSGELTIWFDPESNSVAIHPKDGNPFQPKPSNTPL